MSKELTTIGHNVVIDFIDHIKDVPAKVDTGADRSSVWASDIDVDKDGQLSFVLFDKKSPLYTGKVIKPTKFSASKVRSSSGHEQIRYRTELLVEIASKRVNVLFTLSNRSRNTYPVLIGRRSLFNKFIVDVSQKDFESPTKGQHNLSKELAEDPYKFHKKYHGK